MEHYIRVKFKGIYDNFPNKMCMIIFNEKLSVG